MRHHYQDLIILFNQCFAQKYNTQLIKGEDEPFYQPAGAAHPYHAIYFAYGFFSSALHECAHWFIAGSKRRLLEDYGYWYIPDGRNRDQQQLFEQVEVKPQAIELLLSEAARYPFQYSIDNLNGEVRDMAPFKKAVSQQAQCYREEGLPPRAALFYKKLSAFYSKMSLGN